jgi:putative FmdB family regulatory protein
LNHQTTRAILADIYFTTTMPTYEYICDACGKEYEKFQSIMSKPDRVCPSCKARKVRRKIGIGSAVIFKGSGFYETDYRSEGYTKAAEADRQSSQKASQESSGAATSSASTTSATGAAKSDAKSDSKTSGASGGATRDGASTSKPAGESDSSTKSGATSANVSGANSNAAATANSAASGAKPSSASSESSSSNPPRSAASTKQHMASKAVHPSRVGRGQGNLRRKKK